MNRDLEIDEINGVLENSEKSEYFGKIVGSVFVASLGLLALYFRPKLFFGKGTNEVLYHIEWTKKSTIYLLERFFEFIDVLSSNGNAIFIVFLGAVGVTLSLISYYIFRVFYEYLVISKNKKINHLETREMHLTDKIDSLEKEARFRDAENSHKNRKANEVLEKESLRLEKQMEKEEMRLGKQIEKEIIKNDRTEERLNREIDRLNKRNQDLEDKISEFRTKAKLDKMEAAELGAIKKKTSEEYAQKIKNKEMEFNLALKIRETELSKLHFEDRKEDQVRINDLDREIKALKIDHAREIEQLEKEAEEKIFNLDPTTIGIRTNKTDGEFIRSISKEIADLHTAQLYQSQILTIALKKELPDWKERLLKKSH